MKMQSYLISTTLSLIGSAAILHAMSSSTQVSGDPGQSAIASQSSPTCGPAVVALVLKLYGKSYRIEDICRGIYVDDQGGSSIARVCDVLTRHGVYARGCRLSVDELLERRTPTVIFVENYGGRKGRHHFIVYVGHDGNDITLLDPLYRPLQTIARDKLEQKWGHVAIITQLGPFTDFEARARRIWTVAMCASLLLLASTTGFVWSRLHG
jgi:ABC-type bacteriocin/lantibiotic exporter with double-glycine peptidase domain